MSGRAVARSGRHFSELFSLPANRLLSPLSINLDMTVACNYRCPHCIDENIINTRFKLPEDIITRSLINLRLCGLKTVILIGGGEPTLHPQFGPIVKKIKALGIGCAIVTNGSRNDKIADVARYFASGDWIRLSLDSGSDDVFQKMHRPVSATTLESICESAMAIKKINPKVQLGFSFIVISPEAVELDARLTANVQEIEMAAALAKRCGFDYISFKPYLHRDAENKETIPYKVDRTAGSSYSIIREQLARAKQLVDEGFDVVESINLWGFASANEELGKTKLQPVNCHMQKFRHVLTPMGIFACPAYRGDARSKIAEKHGYASPGEFISTAARTMDQIAGFDASNECRNINCIYNATNWWIESLLKAEDNSEVLSDGRQRRTDMFL
jgi:wyosine [tRNA(Phe)-imidazoG37] synthetase (radical SAM superfamily)